MIKDTNELNDILSRVDSGDKLDNYIEAELKGNETDFKTYINDYIRTKDMTIADLQKKSLIDRTYIYQLMDGRKNPGRDKVIAIALAGGMTLKECQKALRVSGNGELYSKSRRDTIITYGVNNGLGVIAVNGLLQQYGEPILS
ncbi:MAG: helix-turn-helix transcriptional regulator [Clostridiales bacterium]|nr:helix-turn-helix transcriptional regulator [Clostridiales bacterium]